MSVTVGILGAGSLFGQGLIKALRQGTVPHRVVGFDVFPHAVGLYWSDASYLLPSQSAPDFSESDYLEQLLDGLREEHVNILLVATEFDLALMARYRAVLEAQSECKVVVSSPEVVEIARDKWATYRFCLAQGLPCPPSLIDVNALDAFVAQHGFPLVVKPRRGSRSRGMSLVHHAAGLGPALKRAGPTPIVQVAVGTPEREYTCGTIVFDGECLGVITLRRDLIDGNTLRAYLSPEPELNALVRQAAVALNQYGPANFQLRVGPEGPAIFEINARFSGTTIIRTLAGFNEVEAVIRWVLFGERLPLVQEKYGVVLRYWEELFIPWEAYEGVGRLAKVP